MKNPRGNDDGMERMIRAALGVKKDKPAEKSSKGSNPIHIKPSKEGSLHSALGVKPGQKIPAKKMEAAKSGASPALTKKIVFAENAQKWNHGG